MPYELPESTEHPRNVIGLIEELESFYDTLDYEFRLRRTDASIKMSDITPEDYMRVRSLRESYANANFFKIDDNPDLVAGDVVDITYGRAGDKVPNEYSRVFRMQLVSPATGRLYVLADSNTVKGHDHLVGRIIHFGLNSESAGFIKSQKTLENVVAVRRRPAIDISGTNFRYDAGATLFLPNAVYQQINVNGQIIT